MAVLLSIHYRCLSQKIAHVKRMYNTVRDMGGRQSNNNVLYRVLVAVTNYDSAERKKLNMVRRRRPPEQNSGIEPQHLPARRTSYSCSPGHDQTTHRNHGRIHQDPCSRLLLILHIQHIPPTLDNPSSSLNQKKKHNAHPLRSYLLSPINM